jgi:AraC family L-rhamnose operon regulatory protein RhaS
MPLSSDSDRGPVFEAALLQSAARAFQAGQLRAFGFGRGHYPGRRLRKGHLPGVDFVGFMDAAYAQTWGIGWHCNEGVELMFQESGSDAFVVSGRQFQLKPGDIAFTRPWQQHQVGNPLVGAGRLHFLNLNVGVRRAHQMWRWPTWIVLAPKNLRELTDIFRHNEQPVWHATADVGDCFRRIGSAVASNDQDDSLSISRLAVYLNRLFLSVLEMFHGQTVPLDQSLSTARRTVESFWTELRQNQNYLASEWTVSSMAKRCGMCVTTFIRHSRQLTNVTPCQYLNHCRLSLASELLRKDPTANVTRIALSCGFGSSQYFATQFRRRFGVPPNVFRSK